MSATQALTLIDKCSHHNVDPKDLGKHHTPLSQTPIDERPECQTQTQTHPLLPHPTSPPPHLKYF